MKACLWEFSASDHEAWQDFTGFDLTPEEYRDQLVAIQADMERQGHEVVRVKLTVDKMRRQLEKHGLENTSQNRAAVLAMEISQ